MSMSWIVLLFSAVTLAGVTVQHEAGNLKSLRSKPGFFF